MAASTADVTLSADYDLDTSGASSSISCNTVVSDGSLTDSAVLVVTMIDVNDNTPTFSQTSYVFYTQANTGVGSVLGSIAATDNDIGTYGEYDYAFVMPWIS